MKQCIRCGRQLPDGANFCPGCGTQQIAAPPIDQWGRPNPAAHDPRATRNDEPLEWENVNEYEY